MNIRNTLPYLHVLSKITERELLLDEICAQYADKTVLLSSFSVEDQVIADMLLSKNVHIMIATIDTGRLPQDTYDVIEATRQKYKVNIAMFFPDIQDINQFVTANGPDAFYNSIEARKRCCYIRKVKPLKKILSHYDIWVTGLRREHSSERKHITLTEWDTEHNMLKVNPLFDWSEQQVWRYIKRHAIPYNKLYDKHYTSIGCAPCTRAIQSGEAIRAGRWWWEQSETKECGLHLKMKNLFAQNDFSTRG